MTRPLLALLLGGIVHGSGLGFAPQLSAQEAGGWAGAWNGTLQAGAVQFALVFHVEPTEDGLSASMDSPDQGAFGVPASEVTVAGDSITIDFAGIGGRYVGMLSADTIAGTWTQSGQSFDLHLARGAPPEVKRPQTPAPPFPYSVEEVAFANAEDGVELAGTLTIPEDPGPHPAAVLVSGSGPQNRDEEIFEHRPFHVLADYLTRRGVVVLRYDDRGTGESTGDFAAATSADLARDAEAAIRYLDTREEVDGSAIGIIGHSEGGLIAPLVASRSSNVAWIVSMAGPGMTGKDLLVAQAEAINRAAGLPESAVATNRAAQQALLDLAASDRSNREVENEALRILQKANPGVTAEQARGEIANLTSPWMRWFLRYDPGPALQRVSVPVLAINGSLDLQVPASDNLAGIERSREAGGNDDVTVIELPGLNHLFQAAETGLPSEYRQIEETMSPAALESIGDWILARFGD